MNTEVTPASLSVRIDSTPQDVMQKVFERGVMTTVKIGCERFSFSISLKDLGVVPTREKAKEKVESAFAAVLPSRQRCTLLPRDQMFTTQGVFEYIPTPEKTERAIRALFPTRYPAADGGNDRRPDTPSGAAWYAVPLNGMTFIPVSKWDLWFAEFQKARDAHFRGAQLIVENYDRLYNASIRHYLNIAMDVYNRLRLTAPESLPSTWVWVTEENASQYPDKSINSWVAVPLGPLEWMRRWRRMVERAWPSRNEIIDKYRADARFFWAPVDGTVTPETKMQQIAEKDLINRDEEYFSYLSIRDEVLKTQSSQAQDLAVGYIKTILERVELVFMSFIKNAEAGTRGVTPRSLSTIAQVVDMVNELGFGVYGLKGMRQQIAEIEQFLDENRDLIEGKHGTKAKNQAIADANESLPEVLGRAVMVLRQEAESMIGNEARRTAFSDEDPMELLALIRSNADSETNGRRASSAVPTTAMVSYEIDHTPASDEELEVLTNSGNVEDLTSSRRI